MEIAHTRGHRFVPEYSDSAQEESAQEEGGAEEREVGSAQERVDDERADQEKRAVGRTLVPGPGALHGFTTALSVTAWPDPVIDRLGYDPRSAYVERFWLSILGPSTTWLLRRLATGLDFNPDGFALNLTETARSIGLGGKVGRHGPFQRSIGRLVTFELARAIPPNELAVRRFVPPLPRRHLMRLEPTAYEEHRLFLEAQERPDPEVARVRWRARRMALGLFSLGDGYETVETELLGWRLHPALASDATAWAWRRSGRDGVSTARDQGS